MKLYATTTSERASKGQGGNKYIRIALNVGSSTESREVAKITLVALDNGGYELFYWNKETDKTKCLQTGELKGKQQKGDCKHSNTEWRDEKGVSYLNCFDCGDVLDTKQHI